MLRDEIEVCHYCGTETAFWWDTEKDGYQAACRECGRVMMLCDACMHSEDNEGMQCDWDSETGCCFRKLHYGTKSVKTCFSDYTKLDKLHIEDMIYQHLKGLYNWKSEVEMKIRVKKTKLIEEHLKSANEQIAVLEKFRKDLFEEFNK